MATRKRSRAVGISAAPVQTGTPTPPGASFGSAAAALEDPSVAGVVALARLGQAVEHLVEIESMMVEDVTRARAAGVSWAAIGDVLGMTGEGARYRYSPHLV